MPGQATLAHQGPPTPQARRALHRTGTYSLSLGQVGSGSAGGVARPRVPTCTAEQRAAAARHARHTPRPKFTGSLCVTENTGLAVDTRHCALNLRADGGQRSSASRTTRRSSRTHTGKTQACLCSTWQGVLTARLASSCETVPAL